MSDDFCPVLSKFVQGCPVLSTIVRVCPTMSRLIEKNSNAYELSEFQASVVAKIAIIGIIAILAAFPLTDTFAQPGDLLFTIDNPGLKKDMFSSSLGTLDDLIIVGASGKEVDGIAGAGSLYVFDGITGELKFTIDNPDPKRGDGFGKDLITTDNYIVAGLNIESKNDIGHKGKIFVFDKTGSSIRTIENPNGLVDDGWFASRIGSHGDKIISSSTFQNSDGDHVYMVHVFDESGNLEHTLKNSESDSNRLGYSVSSFGDNIAVYEIDEDANDDVHTNSVHVFDAASGELQYVIENPDPAKGDFGRHIAEVQGNLVIGTPTHMFEEVSGTIHVFDDTGKLTSSIEYVESDLTDANFGGYLTAVGDHIALRSISDQTDHDYFLPLSDVIHVFDVSTGDIVLTIDEPAIRDNNARSFIEHIESTGSIVISGINGNDHNPLNKIVHVFEGPGKQEVNYVDFRNATGEIIEVGCSSGLRASGNYDFGGDFLQSLKCNPVITLIPVFVAIGIVVVIIFIIKRKGK